MDRSPAAEESAVTGDTHPFSRPGRNRTRPGVSARGPGLGRSWSGCPTPVRVPAFPLLLPPECAMTKARPRTAVVVTVVLAGLSFGYGAYLLTLSPIAL